MTSENIWVRIPRTVTLCLLIAIGYHLWAAVSVEVHSPAYRPFEWLFLALAEAALLGVALAFPSRFYIRNMRLVGVAVSANALLILAPLPSLLSIYGDVTPPRMLPAIALGVGAMAAVFLVGMSAGRYVVDRRATRPPERPESKLRERWVAFGIIVLALVVLPVWVRAAGTPPLLGLFTGASASDLGQGRHAALANLDSGVLRLVIGVLRNLLLMFAVGWATANLALARHSRWQLRRASTQMAAAVLAVAVIYALFTTERAVVGEIIVVGIIAYLLAAGRTLTGRLVLGMVGAAALFPILVGVLSGAADLMGTLRGLWRRVFYLPCEVMVRYFAEFPARTDFLDGASVPKLSYLTGGESFDLSGHIFSTYYLRSGGIEGNANGSFFGVGWANAGTAGVVLWAALAAATLVLLDLGLDRLPIRSGSALRALGVVLAVLTTSSDIFRSILGFAPGYLDLVAVVWVIDHISRRAGSRRRSTHPATGPPDARRAVSQYAAANGQHLD